MNYEEAIKTAIEKRIEENILKEFLSTHRNEVLEVMTLDYTWERREELIRRDEHEDGYAEDHSEGYDERLIEQVCKKMKKEKPVQVIADELEEEVDSIRRIVDVAVKYAPEYDVK